MVWRPGVEGLQIRGAFSILDSNYKKSYFNTFGQDLKGKAPGLVANFAGTFGFSYDRSINGGWNLGLSSDARYNNGYTIGEYTNPLKQGSFWLVDAALTLRSPNDRFEVGIIGKNLTNKYYGLLSLPVTGACANYSPATGCGALTPDALDQGVFTSFGRQVTIQATVRY